MGDPEPATRRTAARRRAAPPTLGIALALPALAIVVVGAGAARPPWSGDGAWTTPLQVLLGVVGLVLLGALVLVLRNLPGVVPSTKGDSKRSRWWLLAAAAAVGLLAWLAGVAAREPGSGELLGGDLGVPPGLSGEGVAPLPTSTTAVVAGLVALGLLAALAAAVVRRQVGGRTTSSRGAGADDRAAPPADASGGPLPDGPPDQVVLAAWAAARREVVGWHGSGEHDPPGGLLHRVAGTPAEAPLRRLTDLYLPVRYGRAHATAGDAEAARRVLEQLRSQTSATGAGR